MFTYKVGFIEDENGPRPDLPVDAAFCCISAEGCPTVIVKTPEEVPGLTPLTEVEAEAEVVAMGYEPSRLWDLVVKTDG